MTSIIQSFCFMYYIHDVVWHLHCKLLDNIRYIYIHVTDYTDSELVNTEITVVENRLENEGNNQITKVKT